MTTRQIVYTGIRFDCGFMLCNLIQGFQSFEKEDGRTYFLDVSPGLLRQGLADNDFEAFTVYFDDTIDVARNNIYLPFYSKGKDKKVSFFKLKDLTDKQLRQASSNKDFSKIKHFVFNEMAYRKTLK